MPGNPIIDFGNPITAIFGFRKSIIAIRLGLLGLPPPPPFPFPPPQTRGGGGRDPRPQGGGRGPQTPGRGKGPQTPGGGKGTPDLRGGKGTPDPKGGKGTPDPRGGKGTPDPGGAKGGGGGKGRGGGQGRGGVPSMTAFSVPQHKLMCTIAFGGSVRIARVSACLRKGRASLFKRELDQASVAVSATCLSTSVPHSSGTCLETGIYTTVSCGSRARLAERKD